MNSNNPAPPPPSAGSALQQQLRSSRWIPQLDPFNTYQAWQLATRGKIAVGPNTTKEPGLEASTDNEDGGSDKEELSRIWAEGGERKEAAGQRPQQQAAAAAAGDASTPQQQRRSLMQKDKQRPTTCQLCRRTFRTYHQLVLHSRVHKRSSPAPPEEQDAADEPLDELLTESLAAGQLPLFSPSCSDHKQHR